jgi:archaellum component FlaG (FlaF/FlaG flagellin family)
MKQIISSCLIIIIAAFWQACDSESRYIDPNTGSSLNLREDTATGLMVDKETGKPVSMYVDTKNDDTIYGRTGKVINGKIRRNKAEDGKYTYVYTDDEDNDRKVKNEDGESKIKSGDYKKEVEKDGDITIKDGDTKIKIDGKTGEKKVKKDD